MIEIHYVFAIAFIRGWGRVACENRRIFRLLLCVAENTVCETKPKNDFPDVTGFVSTAINKKSRKNGKVIHTRTSFGKAWEKLRKKICTPRSVVYSARTLFQCLKTNSKCLGKSQLDLGALYRKPPGLMSLFTPKTATNNIRLVFVYGEPNVTRAQLLSFTPLFEK